MIVKSPTVRRTQPVQPSRRTFLADTGLGVTGLACGAMLFGDGVRRLPAEEALLMRLTDDVFRESYVSTIGVDVKNNIFKVSDKLVKLQMWDTAGQERYLDFPLWRSESSREF